MQSVNGTVEAKASNGTGIKVNGTWYNGDPDVVSTIDRGATIDFDSYEEKGRQQIGEIFELKAPSRPARGGRGGSGGYQRGGNSGGGRPQGRSQSSGGGRSGGNSGGAKKGGWDDPNRQAAIIFQSSRKDAIEIATCLLEQNVLPMPAKKDAKFDAFMAFVETKTSELFNEAMYVQEHGKLPDQRDTSFDDDEYINEED